YALPIPTPSLFPYTTLFRSRYDAVKNAFLSYVTATKKPRAVASRINRSGETFGVGKKILGRLRIVGGYLRLFLPLDPKQFNADKDRKSTRLNSSHVSISYAV